MVWRAYVEDDEEGNRCVRLTDDEGRDEFFAMLSVEDLDEDWAWQRVSEYLREAEGDAYNRNMKEKKA